MAMAHDWVVVHILAWSNAQQLLGIILALFLARLGAPRLQALHVSFLQRRGSSLVPGTFSYIFNRLILPLLWLLLLWLGYYITTQTHLPHGLLRVAVSLLFAWVVIRFTATLIRNPALAKLIAFTAWTVAALNILIEKAGRFERDLVDSP